MTSKIRIALAQFDFHVGAFERNIERIRELIKEARDEHKADVILFPELAVCGYVSEDLYLRPGYLKRNADAIQEIASTTSGITAVVGWAEAAGAVVYNSAAVLQEGKVIANYRKRELPNYTVFDEKRYFVTDPDRDNCVFDVNGVKVGLIICEDVWYGDPIEQTVKHGAQVVLVPNASPYEREKHAQRDSLLATRVAEAKVGIALQISRPKVQILRHVPTHRELRKQDHVRLVFVTSLCDQLTDVFNVALKRADVEIKLSERDTDLGSHGYKESNGSTHHTVTHSATVPTSHGRGCPGPRRADAGYRRVK